MAIRKLSTIIVVSFVAVNALFIIGITVMAYHIFINFTSKEISEARLALLNESTQKVSNFITNVSDSGVYVATNRTVLRVFSEGYDLSPYDAIVEQRQLSDVLNGIMTFKRDLHSIEIYTDRYGNAPNVAEGLVFPLQTIEDEPWYPLFETMDNGWIPEHLSLRKDAQVISYFHRLINQQGHTVGHVKVNIRADTFSEYLSEEILYHHDESALSKPDEVLVLIDPRGRIIAQSTSQEQILDGLATEEPDSMFSRLDDPYLQYSNHHQMLKHNNVNYLFLISKPTYERWTLLQLIPIDSLYEETKRQGWIVILIGIAGLVLSVPLSYWIGRRIIVPIRKIIQGMKWVETGNFDIRVDSSHYIEEYDMLAKKFNHMIFQLNALMTELRKESRAKREAEIKMLQSQITPHFLYNTLDIIHWRAMDLRDEKISMMVNQLSKMFRIGLSGGKKFIQMRDELEHARCYVNIQRAQMKRNIQYEVNVPASLRDMYVPKVIVQPFVENSMRHGFPDRTEEQIQVRVTGMIQTDAAEEWLEIHVEDNGCGFPPGWSLDNSSGIGIRNVQDRIRMYCGEKYKIELSQSEALGGSHVIIRLPVIRDEQDLEAWIKDEHQV